MRLNAPTSPDGSSKQQLQENRWKKATGKAKIRRETKKLFVRLVANPGPEIPHQSTDQKHETSGWKEHVWSTFIDRGCQDQITRKQPGKQQLSQFQQKKFQHFFYHVLDLNCDHVISAEDFAGLNKRVRHYMGWSVNNIQCLALKEVHFLFLEFFLMAASEIPREEEFDFCAPFNILDQEQEVKTSVTMEEWLIVWGEVVGKAMKMSDLPLWLQYYPKTLFDTINKSNSGVVSKAELKLFYNSFLDAGRMVEGKVRELTEKSYNAMTSNGDVELSLHIFKLSFLNFLLGKQPNGPGQFMFGWVEEGAGDGLFPINYSATNEELEHDEVDYIDNNSEGEEEVRYK